MKYDKLRTKTQKFYKGGKIRKYDLGGVIDGVTSENFNDEVSLLKSTDQSDDWNTKRGVGTGTDLGSVITNFAAGNWKSGLVGGALGAANAVDTLAMGNKNFGAQSAAIDSAVHGVSGALLKSGNPYAMAAGAAIEGANFLTKATGQTVQGYDVNLTNSGYGNLGHLDSSSSRDIGVLLSGVFNRESMQRKLQDRNELAQMALKASNISDTIEFELEARMNSVEDVLRNNTIALAGGIDTNILGS